MRYGTLSTEEFQSRCEEVFNLNDGDECYGIEVDDSGRVKIHMGEVGTKQEGFRWVYFDYEPDMSKRPEALDYLLGITDGFSD